MKGSPIFHLASALLAASTISAYSVDFIRQIQLVENESIVYDIPVSGATGSVLSKPLEGDGAVFQLYAYNDESYSPWSLLDLNAGSAANANISLGSHLVDLTVLGIDVDINWGSEDDDDSLPQLVDEKTIGTHMPQTTVVLRSEDSYQPPRTRADRPFSMTFSVRGLADPEDPRGGVTKVVLDRDFKVYHPELYIPYPDGAGQGSYDQSYQFDKNGDYHDPEVYTDLPASRPTKAIGEETFIAHVELEGSGRRASIGSETIQIWPVCEGVIEELEQGKRYTSVPPEARIVLKDLYPDSITYAQIYLGTPTLGRVGRVIASSAISFNTYSPQNAVVPLKILANDLGEDGTYTVEVLTITPFNNRRPERVTHISFEVDRTIDVRAMLADSE